MAWKTCSYLQHSRLHPHRIFLVAHPIDVFLLQSVASFYLASSISSDFFVTIPPHHSHYRPPIDSFRIPDFATARATSIESTEFQSRPRLGSMAKVLPSRPIKRTLQPRALVSTTTKSIQQRHSSEDTWLCSRQLERISELCVCVCVWRHFMPRTSSIFIVSSVYVRYNVFTSCSRSVRSSVQCVLRCLPCIPLRPENNANGKNSRNKNVFCLLIAGLR